MSKREREWWWGVGVPKKTILVWRNYWIALYFIYSAFKLAKSDFASNLDASTPVAFFKSAFAA